MKMLPFEEVLELRYAEGDDLAAMQQGCHYDYRAQKWVDGHDHGHMSGETWADADAAPLSFCGADAATCRAGHPAIWGEVVA